MITSANRIYSFSHEQGGASTGVVASQIINTPLQLEAVSFRASAPDVVQIQILALTNQPINAPTALLHGQNLIEFESQVQFVTGTIQFHRIITRKIFDINPLVFVLHMVNASQDAVLIEVIIEAHEWLETPAERVARAKLEQDMRILMARQNKVEIPKTFSTLPEVVDWISDQLDAVSQGVEMSTPERLKARMLDIELAELKGKIVPGAQLRTIWDDLRRLFAGTIFAGFFSERMKSILLEKFIGD